MGGGQESSATSAPVATPPPEAPMKSSFMDLLKQMPVTAAPPIENSPQGYAAGGGGSFDMGALLGGAKAHSEASAPTAQLTAADQGNQKRLQGLTQTNQIDIGSILSLFGL